MTHIRWWRLRQRQHLTLPLCLLTSPQPYCWRHLARADPLPRTAAALDRRGRAAESRAKGAIYGGDARPATPEHHGKKSACCARLCCRYLLRTLFESDSSRTSSPDSTASIAPERLHPAIAVGAANTELTTRTTTHAPFHHISGDGVERRRRASLCHL